jgi:hypothetical protein
LHAVYRQALTFNPRHRAAHQHMGEAYLTNTAPPPNAAAMFTLVISNSGELAAGRLRSAGRECLLGGTDLGAIGICVLCQSQKFGEICCRLLLVARRLGGFGGAIETRCGVRMRR